MALIRLSIQNLRNISQLTLEPTPQFNIIYGENGSGKTSILEAIYLLSLGRSFRNRAINSLIQLGKDKVTVSGIIRDNDNISVPLGIERHKDGTIHIRAHEQTINSIAELAHYLPLQVINQDSYQLLMGSPKLRRQFLDWGLFHVEQSFFPIWKRFQRSLLQRNAALRKKVSLSELKLWDKEFIETAQIIDNLRLKQLEKFKHVFAKIYSQLNQINDIELVYRRGWSHESTLEQSLANSLSRDKQYGFTHDGPHKADLEIKLDKLLACQVLSRGQQKFLTYSLLLAQGLLFAETTNRECIYLVDDMPAELDQNHVKTVLKCFKSMHTQLFFTCIEPEQLTQHIDHEFKMFHVEHGLLS